MPYRTGYLAALILAITFVSPAYSRDNEVEEAVAPADVKPGNTRLLTSGKGMKYFLRIPRSYNKEKGARLIVFMHGSNMHGLQYLRTFEAQRWCGDDIIVCPNGERGSDPYGANNFTFSSAPFVAEVTEDVQKAFNISRTYVGGHSQGGFLTYSVIMHYPHLYEGAFPMAGDCWMQNEPNLWETKPEVMSRQKQIAIAVIHGKADPVVKFSQGEHAYGVFLAMGYPKLRLFAPEKLGHQFALSPVPEALQWLDAMNGFDSQSSMKLISEWSRSSEWGWVHQASLAVMRAEGSDRKNVSAAEKAAAAVEKAATEAAGRMQAARDSKPVREWLPQWFEFRRQFGATEVGKELVAQYESDRAEEREAAKALFRSAIAHRRKKDGEAADEALEKILEEYPHSFHAWYALDWLGGK